MGNDKKIIQKSYAIARTATSVGCGSIIDVCAVDKRYDYNESPSQSHAITSESIMAKRISITRVLAKKSLAWARYSIENLPIKLTMGNMGILTIILALIMPRVFTYIIVYPTFRLVFGTLYPAYASYKAVRTKNVKEYVKWMMYWIVFALFTCAETFTDVFFSFWFPFYYEIKIILVLWLLSPATKGSSILYRRFVHPALIRREAEIDDALARATEQGYTAVLHLGTKGVNYATTVLMQTAIKGGGGLVQQLKKSYSLSDLTGEKEDENRNTSAVHDEADMIAKPRRRENPGRRGYSPRRTQSSCNRVDMFFSEVDVDVREPRPREPIASLNNIRSSDDISSGYSSGEALQSHRTTPHTESLLRTSSVGARTRASKPRLTTKKVPEDEEGEWKRELLSNSNQLPPPSSLSFLSAQKTLGLLLYLSQMHYYIPSNFLNTRINEVIQNYPESESNVSSSSSSVTDVTIQEKVIDPRENIEALMKTQDRSLITMSTCENSLTEEHRNKLEHCPNSNVDVKKVTDEICQDQFNELKQLLNNAHEAVTNIVNNHDDNSNTKKLLKKNIDTTNCPEQLNANFSMTTLSNIDMGFDDRAGKYHKKPAPRVPYLELSTSQEETMEIPQEQQALKATLVIKTGTVTTFTNASNTKHVFVSNNNSSESLRTKKKRSSKENLSRFLAIPKNLFNSAFHKDDKQMCSKIDDSSFISENDRLNNDNVDVENLLLKAELSGDNSTTDNYGDFSTDNFRDECNTIRNAESSSAEC